MNRYPVLCLILSGISLFSSSELQAQTHTKVKPGKQPLKLKSVLDFDQSPGLKLNTSATIMNREGAPSGGKVGGQLNAQAQFLHNKTVFEGSVGLGAGGMKDGSTKFIGGAKLSVGTKINLEKSIITPKVGYNFGDANQTFSRGMRPFAGALIELKNKKLEITTDISGKTTFVDRRNNLTRVQNFSVGAGVKTGDQSRIKFGTNLEVMRLSDIGKQDFKISNQQTVLSDVTTGGEVSVTQKEISRTSNPNESVVVTKIDTHTNAKDNTKIIENKTLLINPARSMDGSAVAAQWSIWALTNLNKGFYLRPQVDCMMGQYKTTTTYLDGSQKLATNYLNTITPSITIGMRLQR